MNLTKLFNMQRELDNRIVEQHGLQGQDLLPQKILALQVELGECANEWRRFKFWSNDQEPKTDEWVLKKEYQHLHITQTGAFEYQLRDEFGHIVFEDVTDEHHDHKNPLLEEYIDCLHFILSIGIELSKKTGLSYRDTTERIKFAPEFYDSLSTTKVFNWVFCKIGDFSDHTNNGNYLSLLERFIALGKKLNFTEEQIEEAYFSKNKVNHERQDTNY